MLTSTKHSGNLFARMFKVNIISSVIFQIPMENITRYAIKNSPLLYTACLLKYTEPKDESSNVTIVQNTLIG